MQAIINVQLKQGVLDPQGLATEQALKALGFDQIKGVRIGKQIKLDLDASDLATAQQMVKDMCAKLLVNGVVESYEFEVIEAA
ncbi:MAG: phosphoribosylformylglycinamidine synthase subunit PurS [Alphaproteobacteria bacterium]